MNLALSFKTSDSGASMKVLNLAIATVALFSMTSALATTSLTGGNRFTGGLLFQDTSYDIDDVDSSTDVEGTLLVGGFKADLDKRLSVGGGVGLMLDGELGGSNSLEDGKGFRLFADVAFTAHEFDRNKIIVTGTLSHDRFSFEESNVDADFRVTELKGGAVIMHSVEAFNLYGGAEFILLSDGEAEYEIPAGSFDRDADRDDRLNLRLGAQYNLNTYAALKADLLILGEQTFFLGADFAI